MGTNSVGLYGEDLRKYLENVGGTPGRDGPGNYAPNWRNRFYGLPDRYDPMTINNKKPSQSNLKIINKILHEAARRARKEGAK
jgi:hypothetical protein